MQKHIIIVILLVISIPIIAQISYSAEQIELHKLTNNWLNTNNAAGLGFVNFHQHGNSELGYESGSGDLHRAQEGNSKSGIRFISERYDKINKNWLSWGSFEFKMNTEENRTWSNVFNTYNSSPYLFGDSIPGRYDQQSFDLHAKICRNIHEKWSTGISFDYFAGDMSRLRDARTRTFIADYTIAPATVYKIDDSNLIGMTAGFRFEKEKMPSVLTVQTDPDINYYFFLGNENANAVKDAYKGFDRQFINKVYFGSLQYNFKNKRTDWLTSVEYSSRNQEVLGSERESPGEYKAQEIHLESKVNIFLNKKLLNVELRTNYKAGYANEFLQELVTTRDTIKHDVSKSWNTLYVYQRRFTTTTYSADLEINLRNLLNNGTDFSWSGGIDGQFYGFSNKYQLPYSAFENQRLRIGLNGGVRIFNKNLHKVNLHAKGGFALSMSDNLILNSLATSTPGLGSSTFEKATYKIANEILVPDMRFYKENVMDLSTDVRYSFPIKQKKNMLTGQVKAYFGLQKGNHIGSWTIAGVSFGIITL